MLVQSRLISSEYEGPQSRNPPLQARRTIDTKKILTDLYAERKRIDAAISALEALGRATISAEFGRTKSPQKESKPAAKKRVLSPEGRKRIAEAAKRRWAKQKRAAAGASARKAAE
jgi:hypothetical protein